MVVTKEGGRETEEKLGLRLGIWERKWWWLVRTRIHISYVNKQIWNVDSRKHSIDWRIYYVKQEKDYQQKEKGQKGKSIPNEQWRPEEEDLIWENQWKEK